MALEAQGSNPCIHPGVKPIMGYRQAVRHSTLTAADVGSNPTSPVKVKTSYGTLAQSVEHLTFNQVVGGSNPPCLIIDKRYRKYDTFYFFAFLMNSASGNRTSFL